MNPTLPFILAIAALLSACQALPIAQAASPESTPAPATTVEIPVANLPLIEKRDTLTATGYAVISVQNHRTPAQQRLLAIRAAKLDAYRSLTEQVYGLRMDATATVADMVVQNDTFRSRVEGVIYGATLVSITPSGDDTYETTLSLDKATVHDLRMLYLGQLAAKTR
jgi:outer membrane protein FlgP